LATTDTDADPSAPNDSTNPTDPTNPTKHNTTTITSNRTERLMPHASQSTF
jgi:hypothetical protein